MSEKVEPVEKIPDWNQVNPDYISKRDLKGKKDFQKQLQREIEKRQNKQKQR